MSPGTGDTQGGPLFCWLGFAPSQEPSQSAKRLDPAGVHDKPQCPDRGFAQRQVEGGGLPWAPWFEVLVEVCMSSHHPAASCDTCVPFSPPSYPTVFALRTEIWLLLKFHLPCW